MGAQLVKGPGPRAINETTALLQFLFQASHPASPCPFCCRCSPTPPLFSCQNCRGNPITMHKASPNQRGSLAAPTQPLGLDYWQQNPSLITLILLSHVASSSQAAAPRLTTALSLRSSEERDGAAAGDGGFQTLLHNLHHTAFFPEGQVSISQPPAAQQGILAVSVTSREPWVGCALLRAGSEAPPGEQGEEGQAKGRPERLGGAIGVERSATKSVFCMSGRFSF